ncbi:hypothetical protein K474DRAFT_1666093 [Panus rudis PR-1116 ss-1]|nr:hypothetical protein K474DRAFT_1666093 [Panus rudis PR-1116 ss-1]
MTSYKKLTLVFLLVLSFPASILSSPIPADDVLTPQPTAAPQAGDDPSAVYTIQTVPNDFEPTPTSMDDSAADTVSTANPDSDATLTPEAAFKSVVIPTDVPDNQPAAVPVAAEVAAPTAAPYTDTQAQYTPYVAAPAPTPATQYIPEEHEDDDKLRLSAESPIPPPRHVTPTSTANADQADSTPASDTLFYSDFAETSTGLSEPTSVSSSAPRTTLVVPPASFSSVSHLTAHPAPSTVSKESGDPSEDAKRGRSQITEQSRMAAIVGILLALACVGTLLGCLFCRRARSCLRRRAQPIPTIHIGQEKETDVEKQMDLSESSPKDATTPSENFVLPFLSQDPFSHSVAVSHAQPQTQSDTNGWRYMATTESGHFHDITHIIASNTFSEQSCDSNAEIRTTKTSRARISNGSEKSSGATSTAQSFSTCPSRYSAQSANTLDRRPSAPSAARASLPRQGRSRSKTVTHDQSPASSLPSGGGMLSTSKSFPANFTTFPQRHSRDSAWSGAPSNRTTGSSFDVAGVYGRWSKDSAAVLNAHGQQLSTISEDEREGRSSVRSSAGPEVEAVEVGRKTCVLVTGKFF